MTDSVNTRELILGILMEVTKEGSYSHLVIRSVLDKYQYLEKKERAFITRVSEGTIQYMIELDYIINRFSKVKVNKMKPVIRNILRMSVYQLKYMDSVPDSAVCNEAVKLAKRKGFGSLSGFVNGVLRNISRNLSTITYPDGQKDQIQYLSVRYSMPEWIVRQWINDYGMEQTVSVLQAFLQETPVTIRTNLLKITPEALEKRLKEEGVTAEKMVCADMPELNYAFMISGFDHLNALASFREGLFYVQDVSSMMVAETVAPKKDSRSGILSEFMKQYYGGTPYIPNVIMTQEEIEDAGTIADWLSSRKKRKVTIITPKKGDKEKMVELAHKNALMVLTKDAEKIKLEEKRTTGAMKQIADWLGLVSIRRAEAYDISNTSGVESVGSMVVFEDGRPKKNDYRKFKIKTVKGPDDYKSMREVLTRRFTRGMRERAGEEETRGFAVYPDLIMMEYSR